MRFAMLAAPLLAISAAMPVAAAPRAALVIGNETYFSVQPVPGAMEAARRAAELLEAAGFEVTLDLNVDSVRMTAALSAFESHVRDSEIAAFVYVGRAVTFGGDTWLVPVGADAGTPVAGIGSLTALGTSAVPLALPLGIAGQAGAAVVVIDGAWPARFDGKPGLGVGAFHEEPGVAPGIAAMPRPGALIVSATAPGADPGADATANTGTAKADFVPEALAAILGPEADLAGAEERLGKALPEAFVAGTLAREANLAQPSEADRAAEIDLWEQTEATGSAAAYAAFLKRYPQGAFAPAAKGRLETLEGQGEGYAAAAEDALGLDAADRRGIGEALKALGHDPGAPEEIFGPDARRAIRAWQADAGAEPTGFLTREQARELLAGQPDAARP